MYDIFSKYTKENRTQSSNINALAQKNLKEKINLNLNKHINNKHSFLKTLINTHNNDNYDRKENNRKIYSSHGYRTVYVDDKIKLVRESEEILERKVLEIPKLNIPIKEENENNNGKNETQGRIKSTISSKNNRFKTRNKKSSNILNSNNLLNTNLIKSISCVNTIEQNDIQCTNKETVHCKNIREGANIVHPKENKIQNLLNEKHLLNLNENTFSNVKNIGANNSSRKNINTTDDVIRKIYSKQNSEKLIRESKRLLTAKKEIRSKIYRLLNSNEGTHICDDFLFKIENFNHKLVNTLQSEFNLNREGVKSHNFHFSKHPEKKIENEQYTNINVIKEAKVPLEELIKYNFSEEELDVIKYDFDFFNKNNKSLNKIKFLKPKSLVDKFIEEDKIIENKKKNIKNLRTKELMKKIFLNKILVNKDMRPNSIQKNYDTEISSHKEDKIASLQINLSKKISSHINVKHLSEEAMKKENTNKFIANIFSKLHQKLNSNKRMSHTNSQNMPNFKDQDTFILQKNGLNKRSPTKGSFDNALLNEGYSIINVKISKSTFKF